jgi:N-methylhydantoinase B/oxoprolinase/acetone carboxylase alpha subunit
MPAKPKTSAKAAAAKNNKVRATALRKAVKPKPSKKPAIRHDPITLEIIQNSLQSISDEMFAAMRKTAMSAIIYEVLDMGTAITDGEGNLAASGAGIPAFVGVLDKAVQKILQVNPREDIHPGDVFITNDPFYGGVTHLNDAVLAMPVFHDGQMIAWTANIAHWSDVGGLVAGSMSNDAKEIFQEGLRLPAVKVDQLRLNLEPGGEGQFRGGMGIVLDYRVRSDGCFFTCAYTRNIHKPWALAGGNEGSPNYVEVIRKDGSREKHAVVTALKVNQDDVIRIFTAKGGGYGDPSKRSREKVLEDLKNGYITPEEAREVYGVG